MYSEEEFLKIVKNKTGFPGEGKTFGFVMGTHTPFGINRGMASASTVHGYTIWKKEGDKTTEKNVNPYEETDSLKTTINFLNNTGFKIKLNKVE